MSIDKVEKIIDEKYNNLSLDQKRDMYSLYFDNKDKRNDIYNKIKKIIFKSDPPTPEDFLDPKNRWLPRKVLDEIYPHIKQDFIEAISGSKSYFQLVFYGATRLGKTYLARLIIIYTIIFIHHLREPALYYGLSALTKLAIYIISFKFDKTRQLYLDDIYNYLDNSERFHRVTFERKVKEEQEKWGTDKIVWSRAAIAGEITLASGLQILLGNKNPHEIIGADVLQCYISEITFFIEQTGASEDDIFELYTNAYDRINATVGNEFLSHIFLDSSANYADSKIEKEILEKLQFDDEVFFRWRARWESGVQKLPKWERTKETFKVITGNGDIPAQLVTNDKQLEDVPEDLIFNIPIDLKKQFEKNLTKSIKDIAGRPTSNESKLIQNKKLIQDMWQPLLLNVEGGIISGAEDHPEKLIWNKIKDTFFNKVQNDQYVFYRAPTERRYIAIDTAYSSKGDIYGITMGHLELLGTKRVFVVDFSFPILPGKEGINLSSVREFILDLRNEGNLVIEEVVADSFQSEQLLQDLKRLKITSKKRSVDVNLEPYLRIVTGLTNKSIKCGKNIFLKNNLIGLEKKRETKKDGSAGKEKIDHPKGKTSNKYMGDWDESLCGVNAKDVSDTLANSAYSAFESDYSPSTIYNEENKRFTREDNVKDELIDKAYDKLLKIY